MAKKQFVLIIDTETTFDDYVADFAAIVVDRKGNTFNQCAVLVNGYYNSRKKHPLFFDYSASADSIWNKKKLDKRYQQYSNMLESGSRMLASASAINRWLDKVVSQFDPFLTAYNLLFDVQKCENTGIDLTGFTNRFCLMGAAASLWAFNRKYKQFILETHGFNSPTKKGNMTYKVNAEVMARFVLGDAALPNEPHTALEDIVDYELPIFKAVAKRKTLKSLVDLKKPGWQQMQVKNHFKAK